METNSEDGAGIDFERLQTLALEKYKAKDGDVDISAFGEGTGLGYQTAYSLLKRKKLNVSSKTLRQLTDDLDCSADYLLKKTDHRHMPVDELGESIRQLVAITKTLPHSRQHDLLLMAKTYADNNEESRKRLLRDLRDMIKSAAVEAGRGEELERILQERIDAMENDSKGDLPVPTDEDEDEDADGAEEPGQ